MFTPMNPDQTERLKFDDDEVTILSGSLDRRGPGVKAIVMVRGERYKVVSRSCGLPRCMCDAYLRPFPLSTRITCH